MTLDEYQDLAQRTANPDQAYNQRLAIAALGLTGEAGEFAEMVKKYIGHGHGFKHADAMKELGDVLWYIAEAAACLGLTLETVATANIEKLKARYPEGFSSDRSVNRGA